MAACLVGKLVEGIPAAISRPKAQSASKLLPPPPAAAPRLLPPLPPPGGNLNKSSQSKGNFFLQFCYEVKKDDNILNKCTDGQTYNDKHRETALLIL